MRWSQLLKVVYMSAPRSIAMFVIFWLANNIIVTWISDLKTPTSKTYNPINLRDVIVLDSATDWSNE